MTADRLREARNDVELAIEAASELEEHLLDLPDSDPLVIAHAHIVDHLADARDALTWHAESLRAKQ